MEGLSVRKEVVSRSDTQIPKGGCSARGRGSSSLQALNDVASDSLRFAQRWGPEEASASEPANGIGTDGWAPQNKGYDKGQAPSCSAGMCKKKNNCKCSAGEG